MNKFAKGLIAGGVLGIAGATMAITDKKYRKRMAKNSMNTMKKTGNMLENVTNTI